MSRVINFHNSRTTKSLDGKKNSNAVFPMIINDLSLELSMEELDCLAEALLYFSGYIGEQAVTVVSKQDQKIALSRKVYLMNLYIHISELRKSENKKTSSFMPEPSPGLLSIKLSNNDIGCISESLLFFSGFVDEQANSSENYIDKESFWTRKAYVIDLYVKVSDHYRFENEE